MARGIILLAFIISATLAIPDISIFFSEIGNDASKVTWKHAVNSKNQLADGINDQNLMMLEADVVEGELIGQDNASDLMPIMAHPPNKSSDISLEQWIIQVIDANEQGKKKGAKLDFKEIHIVEESLMILKNHSSAINFPLWLNADILEGPGGQDRIPLDLTSFLRLCREYFPEGTLSLGWTTGYNSEMNYVYTEGMIEEMSNAILIHNIRQPVTFPIRASLIKGSLLSLLRLIDLVPNCSFTIWSAETDTVDMVGVAELINNMGSNRVYVDLPYQQMMELNSVRQGNTFYSTASLTNEISIILSGLISLTIFLFSY